MPLEPPSGPFQKSGSVAILVDERISRERRAILMRIINQVRGFAKVTVLSGDLEESAFVERLESEAFDLVLAPWYRYLAWSRVESFYGLSRTSGPTFAGYFAEPVLPYELGEQSGRMRALLIDFTQMATPESVRWVRNILYDGLRAGIKPLLDATPNIYCENWYYAQGLGMRIDHLLAVPEISGAEWARRAPALRILLSALWSLIYEEGPGKSEFTQATTTLQSPRAYFQVAADSRTLVLKLHYAMPSWSPKDVVATFWPDARHPTGAAQLLLKHADFLRVHSIHENSDIEVVVGLNLSAPSESAHVNLHTLWIEPLTANAIHETPFEQPSTQNKQLKLLPSVAVAEPIKSRAAIEADSQQAALEAKERQLNDALAKMRDVRRRLADREDLIRDLRAGGVGAFAPIAPPDGEALLDAFHERFLEASFQLQEYEAQYKDMEARQTEGRPASPGEMERLAAKITTLAELERGWIKKLAHTIEAYRKQRGQNGPSGKAG